MYIAKLAKITIFLMCGADRADDLTDIDIPNSIKKCALENLKKKEWKKKKISVRLNCLFK